MKFIKLSPKTTRALGRAGLKLKKHLPDILVGTGIVATVTGTVIACKNSTKVDGIIKEHKAAIQEIQDGIELAKEDPSIDYTEEDVRKDTVIVWTQTGIKFVKLFAFPAALEVGGIACILSGKHILKKRYVSASAALAGVTAQYKDYRKNTIERFGEQVDKELRYGIKTEEVETKVKDEKTGKEKTVKTTVVTCKKFGESDYARFFDERSEYWTGDPEHDLGFIKAQQDNANNLLRLRGHVFLNEVYYMLGLPISKAGQVVGWYYDESEDAEGDNYIDFGLYEMNSLNPASNQAKRDFVNGYEKNIILDFNVEKNILDKVCWEKGCGNPALDRLQIGPNYNEVDYITNESKGWA